MIEWHTFDLGMSWAVKASLVIIVLYFVILVGIGTWNWVDDKPRAHCLISDPNAFLDFIIFMPMGILCLGIVVYCAYFLYILTTIITLAILIAITARFSRRTYKKLVNHTEDKELHRE